MLWALGNSGTSKVVEHFIISIHRELGRPKVLVGTCHEFPIAFTSMNRITKKVCYTKKVLCHLKIVPPK